ncbi:MAG: DsrE family protein [Proteobacteria bacterium]|nr:DsrE family protein [Pseudomonadota bacterium]
MLSKVTHGRAAWWKRIGLGLVLGLTLAGGVMAQDAGHPVIAGFGAVKPAGDAANLPDPSLRYRVVFEVTRAASDPAQINPALERVARFVNLLGASGIRPANGDIVVVIHGPATSSILSDDAYQARFHQANPDTPLIEALQQAGVAIHVCSYALANAKIEKDAVARNVTIDLAAMVTLATLQLKGWVLMTG